MVGREYVVLRSKIPVVLGGGAAFGPADVDPMEALEIEEHTLDEVQRSELAEDPSTEVIAEAMPMTLIEPVSEGAAQPLAGPTWGVDAVGASSSTFDGSGITVAVLDTGIDPGHEAFAGTAIERKNFSIESDDDINGHGTHCAGTIFGEDVNGQRIGVARNIQKALIGKVLGKGAGSSATIAKAIRWAIDNGAHIISMSLGIDFPSHVKRLISSGMDPRPATSMALVEYRKNIRLFDRLAAAVQAEGAFGQGTIIAAATGNESRMPQFSIAVAPPAAGDGITAVGALEQGANGLTVASFSNTEPDVSAPGVAVISAKVGGGLTSKSGTSMATPHVAGVAALWAQRLLESNGNVNSRLLAAQLVAHAETSQLASGFQHLEVGSGIVQAP